MKEEKLKKENQVNSQNFKTIGAKVLLQLIEDTGYYDDAKLIAKTESNEAPSVEVFAKVISVGPEVKQIKEGDFTLLGPSAFGGVSFPLFGKRYMVVNEYELSAILETDITTELSSATNRRKTNKNLF